VFYALRVAELIPPRPKYPIKVNSAEKAVTDYHSQIKSIVNLILDEYRYEFAEFLIFKRSETNIKINLRNISDDDNEFLGLNSDPTRQENEFEIRF
jgi:hypothetical protein